jgi:hypothetical protein
VGLEEHAVDELISLTALRSVVRTIIKLYRGEDLKGCWVGNDEINVLLAELGESPPPPTPV